MPESLLKQIARWTGLVASIGLFVLGVFHVCFSHAHIVWPEGKITDDVNADPWRGRLFTFQPDAFADIWTPMVMGIAGVTVHFQTFACDIIGASFLHYFIYQFLSGLIGSIGYRGGLGILISVLPFLSAAFSLACYFVDNDRASLKLSITFLVKQK